MFKTLRQRSGYNTEYVADLLQINKGTLYKIEEYHLLPSVKIVLKMREIYKCPYEEIMKSYEFAKGVYDERRLKKTNQKTELIRS